MNDYTLSSSEPPNWLNQHTHSDPNVPSAISIPTTMWTYSGTNNSALQCQQVNHTVPTEFHWNLSSNKHCGSKHKRPWLYDDCSKVDDPPCKVHINEEKVAMQFGSMSLQHSDLSQNNEQPHSIGSMWKHYHDLEEKLAMQKDMDEEIDEGVEMDGETFDTNTSTNNKTNYPKLYISPDLKQNMKETLPQIVIPRPCTEVVLWKPNGIEHLTELMSSQSNDKKPMEKGSFSVTDCMIASRKKKTATRSLSDPSNSPKNSTPTNSDKSHSSLLIVPEVRPNTPPPNTSASPVSEDICVCFDVEKESNETMEL